MNKLSMNYSIYWYDYETFGINPKYDRISQFGGIRTDLDLNIIKDPLKIYNRPTPDFVPNPEACLVTGIIPQKCIDQGLNEIDFINKINEQFAKPRTTVCGYNNIHFDDEFTRYALYRNLMDPYAREWQNGNSRWDLINLVRLTSALRPKGINWPTNEKGIPSFKLEDLTKANNISHTGAHDALSDVYATIEVAKLIKAKQPKLFDYVFSHRQKEKIRPLIDCDKKTPLVHSSSKFMSEFHNTTVVAPLCWHPKNKNSVITYDLRVDPKSLIDIDAEEICYRLYTPRKELEKQGLTRIPLKTIQINQAPVIAPINTLNKASQKRISIDLDICLKHLKKIKETTQIDEKIKAVFTREFEEDEHIPDVDTQLYGGGFFSPQDKNLMSQVLKKDPDDLVNYNPPFKDKRLPEMLFRFRARNYPKTLTKEEQQKWHGFCKKVINESKHFNLNDFDAVIKEKLGDKQYDQTILNDLLSYKEKLVSLNLI